MSDPQHRAMSSFEEVIACASYHEELPQICAILVHACRTGDEQVRRGIRQDSAFDRAQPPRISIIHYMIRFTQFMCCGKTVFIAQLAFLVRMLQKTRLTLSSYNVHRLLLASFVVAAKLCDDQYYANKFYASIGGVGPEELNELEIEFLKLLEWDLTFNRETYEMTVKGLKSQRSLMHQYGIAFPNTAEPQHEVPCLRRPAIRDCPHALVEDPLRDEPVKA